MAEDRDFARHAEWSRLMRAAQDGDRAAYARLVRDILLSSKDWSARAFGGYAQERRERHRRLGFVSDIVTGFFGEFGEAGRARRRRFNEKAATDPAMTAHLVANLAGPESQPPEMFTPEHRAYLFDA
jgi:hypothetical protein